MLPASERLASAHGEAAIHRQSHADDEAHSGAAQPQHGGRHLLCLTHDVRAVSPALDAFAQDALLGTAWKRPALSPQGRGLITVSSRIALGQTAQMPDHFNRAKHVSQPDIDPAALLIGPAPACR